LRHQPEAILASIRAQLQSYRNNRTKDPGQCLEPLKQPLFASLRQSYVPPLDLWFNGPIARFQTRLEHSGIAKKIRDAC